jgi:sugar lactone lactonase YvrE
MRRFTLLAGLAAIFGVVMAAPLSAGSAFPEKIFLPKGFQPEGITIGKQVTFYVGSVGNGAIYRGSLRTGTGAVLVPGGQGRLATGMKLDRRGRLFVSGASTGQAYVYDAQSGALLKTYQLSTAPTFINDVVLTRDAAYFTESNATKQVMYRVEIARDGTLGAATTIPLTGDIVYVAGFNANGIEKARGGRTLVIVQSNTGKLFTVTPTGVTRAINLGGGNVSNGDGLLLDGRTLFVARNANNQIAVVTLAKKLSSGTLGTPLTDPDFDFPTTIDDQGKRIFAVNARFTTPPGPTTDYWVAQVAKPSQGDGDDDEGDD